MSNNTELMQHALGISERNREPYRNYFLAGDGHTDDKKWQELVADGFATSRPAPDFVGSGVLYHVTDKGKELAIAALPVPKKSSRYDEYLHSEVCESFGEWLGIELPVYEDREVGPYKWEYRMVRRSRAYWDSYYDICGEWKPTKKAAKASYKEALKKYREVSAMSNNTEALTVDAIKSAMHSSLEAYAFLVVDSLEFELSRKLTDEEQQRVHIFVSSSINESSKPGPCPRCGSRSSRPNGEHYCHSSSNPEASND